VSLIPQKIDEIAIPDERFARFLCSAFVIAFRFCHCVPFFSWRYAFVIAFGGKNLFHKALCVAIMQLS
jgi:hypothetical protein